MSDTSVSRALPGQHAGPALGARGRAGASGDARRHPRRGARPAGRGRVRPRLVPRRLADRRGGPARLAVEPRVARRVPPRPPRLPRGGRLRLLLRGPGLPGPRGLRRGRGARPAPRAPAASWSAPHPRLRPEPHGAGPPLGEPSTRTSSCRGRRSSSPRSPRTTAASRRRRARASWRTGATPTSTAGRTRSS